MPSSAIQRLGPEEAHGSASEGNGASGVKPRKPRVPGKLLFLLPLQQESERPRGDVGARRRRDETATGTDQGDGRLGTESPAPRVRRQNTDSQETATSSVSAPRSPRQSLRISYKEAAQADQAE